MRVTVRARSQLARGLQRKGMRQRGLEPVEVQGTVFHKDDDDGVEATGLDLRGERACARW